MKKVSRHISLSPDVDEHIKTNHDNLFSNLIEIWYREEFMNSDKIKEQIRGLKKQLKGKEKDLKMYMRIRQQSNSKTQISIDELEFWKQSSEILNRDWAFLEGRINLFNKTMGARFGKLTSAKFLEKLDQYRKKKVKAGNK